MDEVKQALGEMRRSRMLVGSNRSKLTFGEPVAERAFGNAITACNFAQRLAGCDCRNGFGAQFGRVRHAASHGSPEVMPGPAPGALVGADAWPETGPRYRAAEPRPRACARERRDFRGLSRR